MMSRAPVCITTTPADLWPQPGSVTHTCPGVLGKAGLDFIFLTGACAMLRSGSITTCLPLVYLNILSWKGPMSIIESNP